MSKRIQVLIHITFWIVVLIIPVILQFTSTPDLTKPWRIHTLYTTGFTLVAFYFSFWLISPYVLLNKVFIKNFLVFLFGASLIMVMKISGYHILNPLLENIYEQHQLLSVAFLIADSTNTSLIMAIAILIRISMNYYMEKQLKADLVLQQHSTELALLKAQINPHFFFNTLNNIYSLVYKKSDDAPEALLKLSEIMRYMLYETKTDLVPLEKELVHLENYLELEKLRVKDPSFISYKTKGDIKGIFVPPLLLLSFVENAFKHGKRKVDNPGIIIRLRVGIDELDFTVINYTLDNLPAKKQKEGIGLQNVSRRLELLYPDSHDLEITNIKNQYKVSLTLKKTFNAIIK
ncbi:MAG: sensor histidine kinase [Bacteroidetes bacterium]|jgi:two-component system, LytTR family, sensor kinase|nr:sensor histidine kinase [Bacteroidota bacterium]MBT4400523.1 sensor histidine kinase [Bacteroidota bacterium]MBT4412252.1 sensor histidine kinase [Bacteroidota bacterium]MBT5428110.1 sensor histidine kinase [Bacteroidota bacterium]MBT7094197.1 sensor histidine kinase [Bacteroidota bacterium]